MSLSIQKPHLLALRGLPQHATPIIMGTVLHIHMAFCELFIVAATTATFAPSFFIPEWCRSLTLEHDQTGAGKPSLLVPGTEAGGRDLYPDRGSRSVRF